MSPLGTLYRLHYLESLSSSQNDVIPDDSSFRHGYRIKFTESIEKQKDLKKGINDLGKSLVELYRTKRITLKPELEPEREFTPPIFASPSTSASYIPSNKINTNRKRGRPVLSKEETDKRAIIHRNQFFYSNSNKIFFYPLRMTVC